MKCPVCIKVDLTISERQGVEIDYCPQCRGVWLDRGELDKIIERSEQYTQSPPVGYNPRANPTAIHPQPQPEYSPDREQPRRDDDDRYESERRDYDEQGEYDQHGRKKRKRGSFLADLFDFD